MQFDRVFTDYQWKDVETSAMTAARDAPSFDEFLARFKTYTQYVNLSLYQISEPLLGHRMTAEIAVNVSAHMAAEFAHPSSDAAGRPSRMYHLLTWLLDDFGRYEFRNQILVYALARMSVITVVQLRRLLRASQPSTTTNVLLNVLEAQRFHPFSDPLASRPPPIAVSRAVHRPVAIAIRGPPVAVAAAAAAYSPPARSFSPMSPTIHSPAYPAYSPTSPVDDREAVYSPTTPSYSPTQFD